MLTQCPECHTVFRITKTQLAVAQGKVRCGRCKHVFNAKDHFQHTAEELAAQNAPLESSPPAHHITSPQADINMPDFEMPDFNQHDMQLQLDTIQAESAAFAAVNAIQAELAFYHEEPRPVLAPAKHNVACAEKIAVCERRPAIPTPPITLRRLPGWTFAGLSERIINRMPQRPRQVPALGTSTWPMAGLSERIVNRAPQQPAQLPLPKAPWSYAALAERIVTDRPVGKDTTRVVRVKPVELYPELTDIYEPGRQEPVVTAAMLTWSLTALLLIAIFCLQTIYLFRDDFAKVASMRPIVMKICELTSCNISVARQLDRIRILHSELVSHPEVRNALLLNAVIENQAAQRQPYPVLQLTFYNLNQQVVGVRRFYAREYLPQDVDIKRGMTPQQPVNISLQLVNPGVQAVSWKFQFF